MNEELKRMSKDKDFDREENRKLFSENKLLLKNQERYINQINDLKKENDQISQCLINVKVDFTFILV